MVNEEGGWTLVLLNSSYATAPAPYWAAAITGNTVMGNMQQGIVSGFDQLLGLDYWEKLGTTLRVEVGNDPLTISHRALYDFSLYELGHYTIQLSNERIRLGGTQPGLYSHHNNQPFTTRDSDNDSLTSGNCSITFNNVPWWYAACWSGSFWGGRRRQ